MDRRDILAERPSRGDVASCPASASTPRDPVHRRADRKKSRRQSRPGRHGAPGASRLRAPRSRPRPRRGEIRRRRQAAHLRHRSRRLQRGGTGRARQVLRRRPPGVDGTGRAAPGRPRHARRGGARGRPRRLAAGKAAAGEVQRGDPPGRLLPGRDRQRRPAALPGRSGRQQPGRLRGRRRRLAAPGREGLREHRPRAARRRGDAGQRGEGNHVGAQHRLLAPARHRRSVAPSTRATIPASTLVEIPGLAQPEFLVEIEVIAAVA